MHHLWPSREWNGRFWPFRRLFVAWTSNLVQDSTKEKSASCQIAGINTIVRLFIGYMLKNSSSNLQLGSEKYHLGVLKYPIWGFCANVPIGPLGVKSHFGIAWEMSSL